ncbi:hypothetical protein [Clostridium aciditolerans]|uniref:Uncharacterized protein n=1 Tax=Clostridium aciditolerans TaxID=339861 RepID=A0A934M5T0_9CLOT|nr:hypothetical protein [Clostridium aciditolerans]MBI6875592.1 hypothetical protein [Clostridium aciditolerans]
MSLKSEIFAELEKLINSHLGEFPKNGFTMTYKESNIEVKLEVSVTPATKVKVMKKNLFDAM